MLRSFGKVFLTTTIILFFAAIPAYAATCFNAAEAEAEQGIRIHSELMVIGLNCQHMQFEDNSNLYLKYRSFTNKHSSLFSGYEDKLMAYYKRTGDGNPEARLNTLRTAFANKISLDAAEMKPHNFCNRYAKRIFEVDKMNRSEIRRWASTVHKDHPLSHPVCEQ